ncbi:MAG: four helix bundle protein [Candidatus Omnitrophica bacterium]|nr:four helix bundle protein [Candidatus Omnitrophota bacterium]MCF7893782.1 four helix bundle protein [Candidatus Omnitrophota bacterium]
MDKKYDIYDRAFEFAVRVAKLIERLPKNQSTKEYSRQLIRASGSIGANIERFYKQAWYS